MKICILHPSYENSHSPAKDFDCDCDPAYYLDGHQCENHFIHKDIAVRQVEALVQQGFDVYVNLCDGAADEDRPGIEVVQALERCRAPFTGAAAHFYEPTRQEMKAACHAVGVSTPAFRFVGSLPEVEAAAASLDYPLIVKHPNSYGSIGLTRESRVETPQALRRQASQMIARFGGALIEAFIDGREFTVLVAENPDDPQAPVAYPALEFLFPAGETFRYFDLKWAEAGGVTEVVCRDGDFCARIGAAARRIFLGLHGNSYARCDFRMGASGELYLLDVNPNCGLFYPPGEEGSADRILLASPGGHRAFLDLILRSALRRNGRVHAELR